MLGKEFPTENMGIHERIEMLHQQMEGRSPRPLHFTSTDYFFLSQSTTITILIAFVHKKVIYKRKPQVSAVQVVVAVLIPLTLLAHAILLLWVRIAQLENTLYEVCI